MRISGLLSAAQARNWRLPAAVAAAWVCWLMPATSSAQVHEVNTLRARRPSGAVGRDARGYAGFAKYPGWRTSFEHGVVVSNRTPSDAEPAIAEFQRSWSLVDRLARQAGATSGEDHQAVPNVLVHLDGVQPPRGQPPATDVIEASGNAVVIHLVLEPGTEWSEADKQRLRRAAAHAYISGHALDAAWPEWFCRGLAGYVAFKSTPPAEGSQRNAWPGTEWSATSVRSLDVDVARVVFLLEGRDALLAPASLTAAGQAITTRNQAGRRQPLVGRGTGSPTTLDQLWGHEDALFVRWLRDPQKDQPQVDWSASAPSALQQRQREMAVLMKLVWRFQARPIDTVEPRVRLRQDTDKSAPGVPRELPAPVDLQAAYRQWTRIGAPTWATLDTEGGWLFSTDTQRLRHLMGLDLSRPLYELAWSRGSWTLTWKSPDGGELSLVTTADPSQPRRATMRFDWSPPGAERQRGVSGPGRSGD